MRGNSSILFIITLQSLYLHEICGDDSSEEAYPNYDYMQIFKGIPALFEYLLNAIEETPEILEKNDINMFKRTIETYKRNEEEKTNKRSIGNPRDCTEGVDCARNAGPKSIKYREPPRADYEYGNNIFMNDIEENICKINVKRKTEDVRNDVNILTNKKLKDKLRKHNTKKSKTDFVNEENGDVGWDDEDGYFGFQNLFGLDVQPEEIQESILLAEKLLEDYNNNKNK